MDSQSVREQRGWRGLASGMIRFVSVASVALPVLSAPGAPQSPPPAKATMIVREFTVREGVSLESQRTVRVAGLIEKLKTALVQSRKFDVLERQDLDLVDEELSYAGSAAANPRQGPKKGRALGADYLVTGEISHVEVRSWSQPIPATDRYSSRVSGRFICDVRVIDVERGKIVWAGNVEVNRESKQISASAAAPQVEAVFYDDLYREAADKVTRRILEAIYPVKVASAEGDTIYLNRGDGAGLTPGQLVALYQLGAPIVDPDTGEELGRSETRVGTARVVEVGSKTCKAHLLSSEAPISPGMLVRPETGEMP